MPLTKKEIARLASLEKQFDEIVLELNGMVDKHRGRVERTALSEGEKYRDYSLPITLEGAAEKLQECMDELKDAREVYADR